MVGILHRFPSARKRPCEIRYRVPNCLEGSVEKKENKATSAGAGGHYVNARLNLIDDSAAESLTSRNAAICPFAGDAPTSELDANIAEI